MRSTHRVVSGATVVACVAVIMTACATVAAQPKGGDTAFRLQWTATTSGHGVISDSKQDADMPDPGDGSPADTFLTQPLPMACTNVRINVEGIGDTATIGVIADSGDEFLLSLSTCCRTDQPTECLPPAACRAPTGVLELEWDATSHRSGRLLVVTDSGHLSVFGDVSVPQPVGQVQWRFAARLSPGESVRALEGQSCAEGHQQWHIAKGAHRAVDQGPCRAGHVRCGEACFAVHDSCMCYSSGILDQRGVWHSGPRSFTRTPLDGIRAAPAPVASERDVASPGELLELRDCAENDDTCGTALSQQGQHAIDEDGRSNTDQLVDRWRVPVATARLTVLAHIADGTADSSDTDSESLHGQRQEVSPPLQSAA